MNTGEWRRQRLRETLVCSSFNTRALTLVPKKPAVSRTFKSTGGTIQSCYED